MKKISKIFMIVITALCALLCISACSTTVYEPLGELSSEQVSQIHDAYLKEIKKDDFYEDVDVEILCHMATFGESVVVKTRLTGICVACVIVEVKVNKIYICSLPDPSYDVIVYRNGEVFKSLQSAYDGGALTDANVLALKVLAKK